jgi:hypothetical protein
MFPINSRRGNEDRACELQAGMAKWETLLALSVLLTILQCSDAEKIYGGELNPDFELVNHLRQSRGVNSST